MPACLQGCRPCLRISSRHGSHSGGRPLAHPPLNRRRRASRLLASSPLVQEQRTGCPFQQPGLKRWDDPATWGGRLPSVCCRLPPARLPCSLAPAAQRSPACVGPTRCLLSPALLPSPLLQPSSVITLPANSKVLLAACMLAPRTTYKQIVVPAGSEASGARLASPGALQCLPVPCPCPAVRRRPRAQPSSRAHRSILAHTTPLHTCPAAHPC